MEYQNPSDLVSIFLLSRQLPHVTNLSPGDNETVSSLYWELDPKMIAITTRLPVNDGKLTVTVINDLSAVVDDVPYVFGVVDDSNTPGTLDAPVVLDTIRRLSLIVPFCNPVVKFVGYQFKHLWYDPSLSFLFSSNLQPNATPQQKKQHTAAIIVGSVVGGLIVMLAIAIVIAYLVSPRIRLLVRPFLKRQMVAQDHLIESNGSAHSESPKNQGWAKSKRPADI